MRVRPVGVGTPFRFEPTEILIVIRPNSFPTFVILELETFVPDLVGA